MMALSLCQCMYSYARYSENDGPARRAAIGVVPVYMVSLRNATLYLTVCTSFVCQSVRLYPAWP